jgi:hypothetical protein
MTHSFSFRLGELAARLLEGHAASSHHTHVEKDMPFST